jgi:hypothetical protein
MAAPATDSPAPAPAPTLPPLVASALEKIGVDTPTADSLLRIAVSLAAEVNNRRELSGEAKRNLVVSALREALSTPAVAERLSAETAATLRAVVDTAVPITLTLVIGASRGEFASLRKPVAGCLTTLRRLLCRGSTAGVATSTAPSSAAAVVVPVDVPQPAPAAETSAAPEEVAIAPTEPHPEPTAAPAESV